MKIKCFRVLSAPNSTGGTHLTQVSRTAEFRAGGFLSVWTASEPRLGKELTACLKKHMKKGRAWARVGLANGSKVSTSEMMALYHEAARQGHPVALYAVGRALLVGFGCPVDLTQAEIYLERCLALSKVHTYSNNIIKCCKEDLVQLASHHFEVKSYERAKSIALPLAEEGFHLAQLLLGSIFTFREGGNTSLALQWYSAAAFTSSSDWGGAEVSAMLFSMILERHAQAKFWGRLGKKGLVFISDTEVRSDHVEALVQVQRELRAIRDVCGGCGVEFEGRERKFCRGCRAYCYCSRECQKMHWNRKDGGHREDCKGMMELKQKMKEKMRVEAMKSSESK